MRRALAPRALPAFDYPIDMRRAEDLRIRNAWVRGSNPLCGTRPTWVRSGQIGNLHGRSCMPSDFFGFGPRVESAAVDEILADLDRGTVMAGEALERVLGAQITLRSNRRLQTAMHSSRLPGHQDAQAV